MIKLLGYNHWWLSIAAILGAYIVGSVSSAILLCKIFKLPDPRSYGSKNPGATNVLRSAGKKLAAAVLALDALKGYLVIYTANHIGLNTLVISIIAIVVVLGHVFPVFFKFSGGKGVATSLGVIFALCWQLAVLILLIWNIVFFISRISSLAALVAVVTAMAISMLVLNLPGVFPLPAAFAYTIIILGGIIIFTHKSNIYKLYKNTENKL